LSDFENLALFYLKSCKILLFTPETQNIPNNHQEREISSKRIFSLSLSDFETNALFYLKSCKLSLFTPETQNIPNNHQEREISSNRVFFTLFERFLKFSTFLPQIM